MYEMDSYASQLNSLVEEIISVSDSRNYWLIRTQSGSLYPLFTEKAYISIDHKEVALSFLDDNRELYHRNPTPAISAIREKVKSHHLSEQFDKRTISLIASQIAKFAYDIKKGDVVTIPSTNSSDICFGIVETGNWLYEDYTKDGDSALLKNP